MSSWCEDQVHGGNWPINIVASQDDYDHDLSRRVRTLIRFLNERSLPPLRPQDASQEQQETFREEEAAVFASPISHYRARCRFAVKRAEDGKFRYFLWDNGAPNALADDFPAACKGIYTKMGPLLDTLSSDPSLSSGLRAVNFLTNKEGDQTVVTLTYDSPPPATWILSAKSLCSSFGEGCSVLGRWKGNLQQEGNDFVIERLHLEDRRELRYKQVEGSFSNPNPYVNEKALGWLCACVDEARKQGARGEATAGRSCLLELFCGNGNHTCALASKFEEIVAVEINPVLCEAAVENLGMNEVGNVEVVCLPSEKFSTRILRDKFYVRRRRKGKREEGRKEGEDSKGGERREWKEEKKEQEQEHQKAKEEQGEEQEEQEERVFFDTVLVDPPRAGLDDTTRRLVGGYDRVLYISCNPEALARDLRELLVTHEMKKFAVFDHFPFTRHVESGVYLQRREVKRL